MSSISEKFDTVDKAEEYKLDSEDLTGTKNADPDDDKVEIIDINYKDDELLITTKASDMKEFLDDKIEDSLLCKEEIKNDDDNDSIEKSVEVIEVSNLDKSEGLKADAKDDDGDDDDEDEEIPDEDDDLQDGLNVGTRIT